MSLFQHFESLSPGGFDAGVGRSDITDIITFLMPHELNIVRSAVFALCKLESFVIFNAVDNWPDCKTFYFISSNTRESMTG